MDGKVWSSLSSQKIPHWLSRMAWHLKMQSLCCQERNPDPVDALWFPALELMRMDPLQQVAQNHILEKFDTLCPTRARSRDQHYWNILSVPFKPRWDSMSLCMLILWRIWGLHLGNESVSLHGTGDVVSQSSNLQQIPAMYACDAQKPGLSSFRKACCKACVWLEPTKAMFTHQQHITP